MKPLVSIFSVALLTSFAWLHQTSAFGVRRSSNRSARAAPPLDPTLRSAVDASTSKGFEKRDDTKNENQGEFANKSAAEIKGELLELLPSMTGQEDEFRRVEELVNALEARYQPAQTLTFLNLAMQGSWQLLFSTNLSGTPNPAKFRLRELTQRIECNNLDGVVTNQALWDLAEAGDAAFDATGTFSVKCNYSINQGARMIVDLEDHLLQPARGSAIPQDVQGLVGYLHRAMPKTLFDPSDHAMDTTYLDVDLRIVRYTGARLEGSRDIFMRASALEINPTKDDVPREE
jgi:hypothetical protein